MPARGEVESDESLRIFDESWQPNHIPSSIGSFARYAQGIFFASQARKSTDSARLVFMFLLRVLCVGLGGVGENRHAMTDEEDCSCARDEREMVQRLLHHRKLLRQHAKPLPVRRFRSSRRLSKGHGEAPRKLFQTLLLSCYTRPNFRSSELPIMRLLPLR